MSVQVSDASNVAAMVAGARAGDEAAFTSLVATYHQDLVRVAFAITGDPDMAADAAQLAWNRAWRKLTSVREATQIRSWLVAIAANEARQLLRRQRRRTVVEIQVAPEPGPRTTDQSASRVDLANALGRLSPEDRELLALRYVIGLDATEIGALRRISPSGTRARLARVLARLRKELDRE
jgi:RNA polymerase sigma-70 factor (ECF subfamily)